MHRDAGEAPASGGRRLQRAVVLELLSDAREHRHSLAELGRQLGARAEELEPAVEALRRAGVVEVQASEIWASPAARFLDELELIAI
ncbi:MAG TPA: hypothetical protein VHT25_05485 [Solirubrobacteraceae bacterium]|jgi:hypothetical protein|nr:hypothetical protein [Solirubrobacteraceae bacterium]